MILSEKFLINLADLMFKTSAVINLKNGFTYNLYGTKLIIKKLKRIFKNSNYGHVYISYCQCKNRLCDKKFIYYVDNEKMETTFPYSLYIDKDFIYSSCR